MTRKALMTTSVVILLLVTLFFVGVVQTVAQEDETAANTPAPSSSAELQNVVVPLKTEVTTGEEFIVPPNEAGSPQDEVIPTATPASTPNPRAFSMPYEEYDLAQGVHGSEYGQAAIDIVAGAGDEILSSIDGIVTFVGTEVVGPYVNTKLVIENDFYEVLYYHGDYDVSEGQELRRGEVVGHEGNHGYTVCSGGLVPGEAYGCGHHTHLNVFDKTLGVNVNPLNLEAQPVVPIAAPTPSEPQSRVARGNFVRDWEQPLAPFWKTQAPTIWWWRGNIYEWAKQHKVNPNAIATIMQLESCGWPNAGSSAGAQGLFQVMPLHFDDGFTFEQMRDIETNAQKGIGYFSYLLELSGDNSTRSLAGYNMGLGAISTDSRFWPAETQRYIQYGIPLLEDSFSAKSFSSTLDEFRTLYGASECASAEAWQQAHPEASRSPGGVISNSSTTHLFTKRSDVIVINLPPVGWLILLAMSQIVIWILFGNREFVVSMRKAVIVTMVTIVLIGWFPINLWHLPKILNAGAYPYNNSIFWAREKIEEKGRVLDELAIVTDILPELPIPNTIKEKLRTDVVSNSVTRTRDIRDQVINFLNWLSDDPILTPGFRLFSNTIQHYLTIKNDEHPELVLAAHHSFSSPFPAEEDLIFLRVVAWNPWGIHGDSCYSCLGLKSWLGTDVLTPSQTEIVSPISGVIEDITLGGDYDEMGASIWVSNSNERFAVAGLSLNDIQNWKKGDQIDAGQKLGFRAEERDFVHLILQIRNRDGTWGDYPLAIMLKSLGVGFGWFDAMYDLSDNYVPTEGQIREQIDLLSTQ